MKSTITLAGLALIGCLANHAAQASVIQSMTIEEIGIASGGLGTSLLNDGGGRFSIDIPQSINSVGFGSAGSTDGALLMETLQGDLAFTPRFNFFGFQVSLNTLQGAPSGSISNGNMSLDLSGWGANVDLGFGYLPMQPDLGSLVTASAMIDPARFFYTADWIHTITLNESATFAGITTLWHLEGIATVPEPSTLWLLGASAFGFIISRRKNAA